MSRVAVFLSLCASLTGALPALAAPSTTPSPNASALLPAEPAPDVAEPQDDARWQGVERPWLYQPDPTAPPPGHVIASLGVGYAQVDRGAARPFAGDLAHAGAVFNVGAEVGLFRYATLQAEGLLAGDGSNVNAGAMIGVGVYPFGPKSPVDLAISGGYLRELGCDNGFWARVAVAGDIGRLRLNFSALGEKVLNPARDEVDILITTGASYAVVPRLFRVGVEYVVQDLEGAWEPEEADGGIRHFIGPVASLELARRVRISAGPALGLSQGSPNVLGRLSAVYAF